MSFTSVMQKIGHDIKVVWTDVVKYLPSVAGLAQILFPGSAAAINVVNLIQQAVATVEQKFVAIGAPSGSGLQKSAQVLAIVGPAVTGLLAAENIKINQVQIQNIINAVVAVLNVTSASLSPAGETNSPIAAPPQ